LKWSAADCSAGIAVMTKDVPLSGFLTEKIEQAAALIRKGGVVAFPTETYYGLAVDPFNEKALQRLFTLKQRSASKPILTLVNTPEQLYLLVSAIPEQYRLLMDRFWPGPLTLIFPAQNDVSTILTGGTKTVGARISSNPIARLLVEKCDGPITATSANLSGIRPASSPSKVRQQFADQLDMIVEGGATPGGSGSTIVGIVGNALTTVRQGIIPHSTLVDAF